jgi:hypothetical protein
MDQLIIFGVSIFTVTLATLLFNQWRVPGWRKAASQCGLEEVRISLVGLLHVRLTGRSSPLAVRFEDTSAWKFARVIVAVPGPPFFSWVHIRRQEGKPAREIEVGDGPFDDVFWIEGPARQVLALLNLESRRLLARLFAQCSIEVAEGEIRAVMQDHLIPHLLPLLLDLGRQFAQPLDATQQLAENAQRDPEAGVRLRNLLVLVRELPDHPLTKEALRAACADTSAEVRLRAAMELGAEGRHILLGFIESLEGDAVSAEAVRGMASELPFERMKAILVRALGRRRIQTAAACVEALGKSRDGAAVEVLAKVMARETGELAIEAALALETTGSPDAEPALLLALERESSDLRVAAASVLGRVGSPAAVLPLKEAAERFSPDQELRRAVRQAIAEIQSRLPGASPGQLSLAGAEAGQLSLAEAEAGQLSLAQVEAGQLSVADDPAGRLSLPAAERGGG